MSEPNEGQLLVFILNVLLDEKMKIDELGDSTSHDAKMINPAVDYITNEVDNKSRNL